MAWSAVPAARKVASAVASQARNSGGRAHAPEGWTGSGCGLDHLPVLLFDVFKPHHVRDASCVGALGLIGPRRQKALRVTRRMRWLGSNYPRSCAAGEHVIASGRGTSLPRAPSHLVISGPMAPADGLFSPRLAAIASDNRRSMRPRTLHSARDPARSCDVQAEVKSPHATHLSQRVWGRASAARCFGIENEGLLAAKLFRDAGSQKLGRSRFLPLAGLLNHKVR